MKKTTTRVAKTAVGAKAATAGKAAAATKAAATKKAVAAKKTGAAKKTTTTKTIAVAEKAVAAKPAGAAKRSGAAKPGTAKRSGDAKTTNAADASRRIDMHIAALADWRGETLARLREIIREADPEVVEEWKWAIPVWSHDGILCTGEIYRNAVKMTFARGAALDDPSGLFNSSLAGNTRRAIDFPVGARIDATALTALIRAAVALNMAKKAGARPARPAKRSAAAVRSRSQ
jgi:hypothetical protein